MHQPWGAAVGTAGVAGSNRLAAGPVRPITVPLWLGAERRGVELGAAAIEAGLRARLARRGEWAIMDRLLPAVDVPAPEPPDADRRLHRRDLAFAPEIAETCRRLADDVSAATARGELALAIGGDHALSMGSIAGAARTTGRLGVLWLDTHGDLNTPATSPTGHIHGLPLAVALGLGPPALIAIGAPGSTIAPEDICLLGARDLDPGERALIAGHGIWTLTMEEWTDGGLLSGLDAALAYLTARGVDAVHLSFDLDVLDPVELPGTGTTAPGGLTYREASQLLRRLHAWDGPIVSVDWVELNPLIDPTGRSTTVAVSLLGTLLGEQML